MRRGDLYSGLSRGFDYHSPPQPLGLFNKAGNPIGVLSVSRLVKQRARYPRERILVGGYSFGRARD
jgi:hypothetical protein